MPSAPSPTTAVPSPARARLGVSLMFFTNGVLLAGLLPRYPEVKAQFGLSATQFGFLVIAMPLGAICAAVLPAPLIRSFGARLVNGVGSVLLAAIFAAVVHSPTPWWFAAGLFVAGAVDSIVDSAQNVQGVIVEEWKGRSIINSFHAVWSLGATAGGLVGTWCAGHDVPLTTQMALNGAVWVVVAVVGAVLARTPHDGAAARGTDTADAGTATDTATDTAGSSDATGGAAGGEPARGSAGRQSRLLAPLVVLAIAGTLMEEVANSWSALFFARETDVPSHLVGLGYTVALACQFVGRLLGDPMTDRWGREAVARLGGLLVAAGMTLAVLVPAWQVDLAGFGLMGFGCATLVPAAFAAAGRVPGLAHGSGIAILGWLMRLGFLLTSPVIGAVADATSLRTALVVPLLAGLVAAGLSHGLARRARA